MNYSYAIISTILLMLLCREQIIHSANGTQKIRELFALIGVQENLTQKEFDAIRETAKKRR